ncbi:hypothetical protein KFE96_09450 [Kordiimonas sp. SCSIO 12603]|uniref:hypothetical protein n=1 Tax=Kordiimonas sp. SCSIO 12603 TaxID=2829596 RepID=UPI002103104D|nr:hypothetical protein [Kordiimonas sp. SCSIO 12603]UTW57091.1 hypothetical protein KFE96_09450 [Kordiimonas sp. SCSIO 12603]
MRFSQAFGLNKRQSQLDFVDIDVSRDFPLYIDPATFLSRDDEFSIKCSTDIADFFEHIFEAIKQKKFRKGLKLLEGLREPNEVYLGVSKGKPNGRGVGKVQAQAIFQSLVNSKAASTGLLTDLSDCALFVPGIGPDKISDITTNIIRRHLIEYTQNQCRLHGIDLDDEVPSGIFWDYEKGCWHTGEYVNLPLVDGNVVILVPKRFVKWPGSMQSLSNKYYTHFVSNFIREEQLETNGALVQVAQTTKRRYVLKKDIEKTFPQTKGFLVDFSEENPKVFRQFKESLGLTNPISDKEFLAKYEEDYSPVDFGDVLIKRLGEIPAGRASANEYHRFIAGVLSYLFYPDLVCPEIEYSIHSSRKKIDIKYTNAADKGFFRRAFLDSKIQARKIMIECKNYFKDIENPEIDQMSGRFSTLRGQLGFLIFRSSDNMETVLARCQDTARDGRGFIIPICDEDIICMIGYAQKVDGRKLDRFLQKRFNELLK